MAQLDVVHLSSDCTIGVLRQVLVQHWFGPVDMPDAEATMRAHNQALRGGSGKVSVLAIVEGVPGLPDQPVRAALARLADKTSDEVGCHATVILAEGFKGSALRSVLTAIFALSGVKYPKQVFATVKDAADWMAEQTNGFSRTEMVVAAEELMAYGPQSRKAS
jgi:hypothetical protein